MSDLVTLTRLNQLLQGFFFRLTCSGRYMETYQEEGNIKKSKADYFIKCVCTLPRKYEIVLAPTKNTGPGVPK